MILLKLGLVILTVNSIIYLFNKMTIFSHNMVNKIITMCVSIIFNVTVILMTAINIFDFNAFVMVGVIFSTFMTYIVFKTLYSKALKDVLGFTAIVHGSIVLSVVVLINLLVLSRIGG